MNRFNQLEEVKSRLQERYKQLQNDDAIRYNKLIEDRYNQEVSKARLEVEMKRILDEYDTKK